MTASSMATADGAPRRSPYFLLAGAAAFAVVPSLGVLSLLWLELTDEDPLPLWQFIGMLLLLGAPAGWMAAGWISSFFRLRAIAKLGALLSLAASISAAAVWFALGRLLA